MVCRAHRPALMSASITPSLTPRSQTPQQRVQPPPIPPRSGSNTDLLEAGAYSRPREGSIKSQGPPPLPRRASPAPARLSTSPSSSDPNSILPKAVRRDPPPRPVKTTDQPMSEDTPQPSFVPTTSTISEIQRQRSLASTSKPNALPPRPQSKVSVDMDGPPPSGLVTPVLPTQKSQPPLPVRKPTVAIPASTSDIPRAASPTKPFGAHGTTRTGSVADRLKQWEQIGSQSTAKPASSGSRSPTKSSLSTSPAKKAGPSIPEKPDTLRKPSTSSMSASPS